MATVHQQTLEWWACDVYTQHASAHQPGKQANGVACAWQLAEHDSHFVVSIVNVLALLLMSELGPIEQATDSTRVPAGEDGAKSNIQVRGAEMDR